LVFSRFSPKKVPFEDTTEAVVALAVGRWDGGSLSAWSPHARPESHIIKVDDEVKAA